VTNPPTADRPRHRLQRLIDPRHIAFIGGQSLAGAIRTCERLGFDGEIWVVNPVHDEIAGHPCVGAIAELPQPPDAAFVGVRRDLAIEAIRDLAALGAGGCVTLAAGFAEVGGDGKAWQQDLIDAAGAMPLIGPNCYGLLNYLDGVALWPDLHGGTRVDRGVALISQSGNISLNVTMADRSLPLSHVLSIGNQAVVGVGEYIEMLLDDPRVDAIGLYIEGIADLPSFEQAATRAATMGVPIVALKAGGTPTSARIVADHTGSDAGSAAEFRTLLRTLGVAQVDTLPELLESLKLVATWRDDAGPALGLLTASGGDSALVADLALADGLTFPRFDRDREAHLGEQLGELVAIANPLDYNTLIWCDRPALERCFTTVMQAPLDAVVLVLDHPRPGSGDDGPWETAVDAFIAAHRSTGRAAAVLSILPESMPRTTRDRLSAAGIVPLQGVREGVTAISAGVSTRSGRAAVAAGHTTDEGVPT
jgi:acetate---CoA ligase (ADP-forming)